MVETHVNARGHRNYIRSFGTGKFVAGDGRSEVPLAIWRCAALKVEVIFSSLHLFVTNSDNRSWLTTLIYGSNCDRSC